MPFLFLYDCVPCVHFRVTDCLAGRLAGRLVVWLPDWMAVAVAMSVAIHVGMNMATTVAVGAAVPVAVQQRLFSQGRAGMDRHTVQAHSSDKHAPDAQPALV